MVGAGFGGRDPGKLGSRGAVTGLTPRCMQLGLRVGTRREERRKASKTNTQERGRRGRRGVVGEGRWERGTERQRQPTTTLSRYTSSALPTPSMPWPRPKNYSEREGELIGGGEERERGRDGGKEMVLVTEAHRAGGLRLGGWRPVVLALPLAPRSVSHDRPSGANLCRDRCLDARGSD